MIRVLVSSGSLLAVGWGLLTWSGWGIAGSPGQFIFRTLSWSAFAACVLAGVARNGDAISQERREGTIGLLFLTKLSSHEIVAGKFVAGAMVPFCALLGLVPALGTCLLTGGTTFGELRLVLFALANTLFFSLALSLFASSCCESRVSAYGLSLCLVGGLIGVEAALMAQFGVGIGPSLGISPASGLISGGLAGGGTVLGKSGPALARCHFLSWLALLWAARTLSRKWTSANNGTPNPAGPESERERVQPKSRAQVSLDDRPLLWLAMRGTDAKWPALGVLTGICAAGAMMALFPRGRVIGIVLLGAMHLGIRLAVVAKAGQALLHLRRSGAMELLLTLPIQASEIGPQWTRALSWQFRPAITIGLATHVIWAGWRWRTGDNTTALLNAVGGLLLCLDCSALIRVGLWRGLRVTNLMLAMAQSLLLVSGLGALCAGIVMLILARASMAEWIVAVGIAWGIVAFVMGVNARNGLQDHLQSLGALSFMERMPTLKNRWSAFNWEEETDASGGEKHKPTG